MRTLQTAKNKKPTLIVIDNDEAMLHSLERLIRSSGHLVLGHASAKSYLDGSA